MTNIQYIYTLACDKIEQAKLKCISNYCRNSSGILWESLWKYEDGKIKQKTCCSGLFYDWYIFEDEQDAINTMVRELKIIHTIKRFINVFKDHLRFQKTNWEIIDCQNPIGTRLSYINSENIYFYRSY